MTTLKKSKITFIGMSGIGKSSFGKALAKKHQYTFIDTDEEIKKRIKVPITHYIKTHSEKKFNDIEESTICSLFIPENSIISTGGSVIYSKNAMSFLQEHSHIVFLHDTLENIQKRIKNFEERGVIMKDHSSIENLFNERLTLYKQYANTTITYPTPFSFKRILNHIDSCLS